MTSTLSQTPLHSWHASHGAKLVDFAGWSMPVQYSSIIQEHTATRTAAGVFDVSHMGRLRFDGPDAAAFLDRLLTRRVSDLPVGGIRYSLMVNEQGGILDDVLAYHLETPSGSRRHMLVVNASNREKIVDWIQRRLSDSDDLVFSDRTVETAMIAVQGPAALQIVDPLVDADLAALGYYTGIITNQFRRPCTVTRTGYTGEDGVELIVRGEDALDVWKNVFRSGRDLGIEPAGLGSRDTLRLEAAMPLYGHELSEQIDPYQAGLGFAVNLQDRDFIGREALVELKNKTDQPKRVGLEISSRRVPREHYPILSGGETVGEVTSGTFSPTLGRPIAMGYLRKDLASPGTELAVDVRGRSELARVVKLPFYKRES